MPEAVQLISRSRRLVGAVTLVIAGLVLASVVAIWALRDSDIAETEADNHRLGVVLAEQTTRTVQSIDLVLREMVERIQVSAVRDSVSLRESFGGSDVHQALVQRLVDLPQAEAFTILDSAGHSVNGSRQFPPPLYSLAGQGYFRALAGSTESGLFISEPDVSKSSGRQTVFLARRLAASDGTFLGVIVAPILLDYFRQFFAECGFDEGRAVTLLRRDGTVLVRYPEGRAKPGMRIPETAPWYKVVAAGGGHYLSPGVIAGPRPTYVSVHPSTLYPIVVDVTRTEQATLAGWRRRVAAIGGGALIGTVCLGLLLRALGRQITEIEVSQTRIQQQVASIRGSEARYAAQSAMLETTLEHMNQGIVMVDAAGNIVIFNRRMTELLDLPVDVMSGRPPLRDVFLYLKARGEFGRPASPSIDDALILNYHATFEHRRPNGVVLEIRSAALAGGGMVRTYTDVTARAAAEEMLGLAASQDQLTGLANRNGFNAGLDGALAAAQRSNTGLAVLCLDLDRFKAVNDTHGHAAGDRLLMDVAQRIREVARSSDVVARLGGDEFALVLPGANQTGAEHICERLLEAVRQPYMLAGETVRIGVSIGVAIYPDDGGTAERLLSNADTALYQAKTAGRNSWCAYTQADGRREHQRMLLEQDLRMAVELRQFSLAYQPICDSVTSEPVSFEALLRWNHPRRGAVSPAEFIPIAEETGLIIPLGRWVLEVACAEAAAWAVPLHVAVNLSPAQFRDHDLPWFIQDVLARTGLPPDRLELEVTEGLLLDDMEGVVKTMQALRGMGIRMVLDDFGTAHSNLSYLRGFPFDAVKIDRSFLRALNSDPQARALVEAILAMARALGLDVVGEGVETPEQLALLAHLRCRWVQGYLLGRPAPSEETRERVWRLASGGGRSGKSEAMRLEAMEG